MPEGTQLDGTILGTIWVGSGIAISTLVQLVTSWIRGTNHTCNKEATLATMTADISWIKEVLQEERKVEVIVKALALGGKKNKG